MAATPRIVYLNINNFSVWNPIRSEFFQQSPIEIAERSKRLLLTDISYVPQESKQIFLVGFTELVEPSINGGEVNWLWNVVMKKTFCPQVARKSIEHYASSSSGRFGGVGGSLPF